MQRSPARSSRGGAAALPVLVLSCLVAAAQGAPSGARYVSSSRGSDANDGLSPATPWQTLEHASGEASGLTDGAILLRAGDAWTVSAPGAAGFGINALTRVTIGPYADADGPPASVRPRITRPPGVAGAALYMAESQSVAVTGLAIDGGEYGVLFVYGQERNATGGVFGNLSVTDVSFSNIRAVQGYDPDTPDWWGAAVAFAAASAAGGPIPVAGLVLAGNLVRDSDALFRPHVPWPSTDPCIVTGGLIVDANVVVNGSYNQLFLDQIEYATVTRNVFLRDTPQRVFNGGTTDIIMGFLDNRTSVVDNDIVGRGEYPGAPDGCGADFETDAKGVVFARNYISRAWGAGVMVLGHTAGSNTALRFEGNRFIANSCPAGSTTPDRGAMAFLSPGSSGAITGNLISSCAGVPVFNDAGAPGLPGWTVEDNRIDGANATLSVARAPVVAAAPAGDGGLLVTASAPTPGTTLVYTLDGSRPEATSPPFPAGGVTLPPGFRDTAVLVKAFWKGKEPRGVTRVESETAGGIYFSA